MSQEVLKNLWQKTKTRHNGMKRRIAKNYIDFLRRVAIYYLKKGRRVFF